MKKIILSALVIPLLLSFSYAQTKHVIGEKWGGGIVFIINRDGRHGLIAETLDQGNVMWFDAKNICKTGKHSKAGKAFTDWRLPTKIELHEMYIHIFDIEGFTSGEYWSSTEDGIKYAWCEDFVDATQSPDYKDSMKDVRAVRAF
jgi:hypothetical protein